MHDMFESRLKEEYKGAEVMFLHVHAGQAIHMRDTEVRKPADLAGEKLRIPTRTGAWVIEALGAAPAAMPVPALPQALQKGRSEEHTSALQSIMRISSAVFCMTT